MVPVRCCCTPELVLGLMPINSVDLRRGEYRVLISLPKDLDYSPSQLDSLVCALRLRIDYCQDKGDTELAVRSDDRPLREFQLIRGFITINQRIPIGTFNQRS